MSHLRAPAARADRREGGRHGRPVARAVPSLPETHIRPQLLRLAILPPTAVALSACAAVLFTVRSTGAPPSLTLWAVLAGAMGVALTGILIAAVAADRAAKSVRERVGALRRGSARSEADLRTLVEALRHGESPPNRKARRQPPTDADDFELLAADMARAHDGAVTAVVQAAQLSSYAGSEQKVEVFVNLARRLQSLVHREISILDELENEIEDPDLLKGLFHVDHLATRIRRHAENLAVLGGAVSRRQWSNPVSMTEVLRSAIAEVEQYSRVKLVPPIDGTLRGHAVADVIHLLAELVENATVFSAPHTQVLLRANLVTSGLAVEVEDRGLGMPVGEQNKMNALLADPDQVNVASLLQDGRIGLFVVSQLARRHGIHVRLQTNIYGGVQAVLVVPQALLGTESAEPGVMGDVPSAQPLEAGGTRRPPSREQVDRRTPGSEVPPTAGAGPERGAVRAVPRQTPHGQRPPDRMQQGRTPIDRTPQGRTPQDPLPPDQGPRDRAPAGSGGAPAPLPVRGAHLGRPNPAEAVPGIRPGDRPTVTGNATAPPTPRNSAVRGTMGKPQLPRRRAQEHIAPQLREGPTPRQDSDEVAGHDPGLMAAFQRGIGLAEAQYLESARVESTLMDARPMDVAPMGGAAMDASPMGSAHMGDAHVGRSHMGESPMDGLPMDDLPMDVSRIDGSHVDVSQADGLHVDGLHADGPHVGGPSAAESPVEASPMGAAHIADAHTAHAPTPHAPGPHAPAPHEALGRRESTPAPGHDLTARQDGSTPAG
ncbi:ATP-binding protein [Streptomyces sp. NPDC005485]|uniref:sensor histidine kinase n=1 Tax=Streptomyces sp. NPDC005485 TaxID=3155591 RepID=UPI0033BCB442